jgi:hypothetical protein
MYNPAKEEFMLAQLFKSMATTDISNNSTAFLVPAPHTQIF